MAGPAARVSALESARRIEGWGEAWTRRRAQMPHANIRAALDDIKTHALSGVSPSSAASPEASPTADPLPRRRRIAQVSTRLGAPGGTAHRTIA